MKTKRVSIKDIAQKVGVSNATVSLVLNGKEEEGRIRKEVAAKVLQAAKELNYEPNNFARGLRMGRSNTIGLILADISNSFFAHIAFYIQEYADEYGYSVIITNTNESGDKMGKMINVLKSHQVDGFIIVPTEDGEEDIRELIDQKTPVVLLDRYFPHLPVSHIVVNNYHASFEATNLLLDSECQNIALLIYNNKLAHMTDREKGYREALVKRNYYKPELVKKINYNTIEEDISTAIKSLLLEQPKVDGIFFATNTISAIGIKELLKQHVRIPEDIKVVCFDKNEAFDFMPFQIPYVQQPIQEMSRKSVDILMEQIKQSSAIPTTMEMFASMSNKS